MRKTPDTRADLAADTRAPSRGSAGPDEVLVPGLTVLCHPDLGRVGERAPLPALGSGRAVPLSRAEPLFAHPGAAAGTTSGRPLAEPYLSRTPIRLTPAAEGVTVDPTGSPTPVEAEGEPLTAPRTFPAEALHRGVVLLLAGRVVLLLHRLDPLSDADLPRFGLVGESPELVRVRRDIARVADLDVPVLLRGETGTGKELVAGAIHRAGMRREKPYVTVNLAAVPPSLAAAELFGASRGAFTGADRRRLGYFQRAEGGTLFLDEIGAAPPDVQALLLRALESREIQPVGAEEPLPTDVRVISASDADLEAAVAEEHFRSPLLHRLAGFEIDLPPLRERRGDLGRLLVHFLREELDGLGEGHRLEPPGEGDRPWLPASLVAKLALHSWPGNVRQLRNVARQLVIASRGSDQVRLRPSVERLLHEAGGGTSPETVDPLSSEDRSEPRHSDPHRRPDEITGEELLAALEATRFRPYAAAHRLGISRASVYDLMAKHPGIRTAGDLDREEIQACRERCGGDLDAMAETLKVSPLGLRRRMGELGI